MVIQQLITHSNFCFGIVWSELYQNSVFYPRWFFFPFQMGNFVLWVKLYWLQACRFFSLSVSLHMWNWAYVSVLERDMRNNSICGRRRNHRPPRMCHFPRLPFELSVNSFGAYCVLFVFFLKMHFSWKTTSLTLYKHLWLSPPLKYIAGCLLNIQWVAGYCWYAKFRLCGEGCPEQLWAQCWLLVLATNK